MSEADKIAAGLEAAAEKYVEELFKREYPDMIDDDGEHMIVEFSESDLRAAFVKGALFAQSAGE